MSTILPEQVAVDPIRIAFMDIQVWSQQTPIWQRDALRRLYVSLKLTSEDAKELYALCRKSHGLLDENENVPTPQPLDANHVPADLSVHGSVALKSLGNLQNVNALADDQNLQFAETGLTIVYGDNGSGKSGYGRVLKRACRARDQEEILPNVYSPPSGKASAQIKYSIGGNIQPELIWHDGVTACPELSNISVFDSKCASVHVDGKNGLAYTPAPLQMLQGLAETCRNFGARLKSEKSALEAQIPSFRQKPLTREGTAVHQLVISLSATTPPSSIKALATVSEEELARLQQLKQDLALDPAKEVRKLQAQKDRLNELSQIIEESDKLLLESSSKTLLDLLNVAEQRAIASNLAAQRAFGAEPLPQAGSEVWKTLWEAARAFSTQEAYPTQSFPNTQEGSLCVLCQQALLPEAVTRLRAFEAFVEARVQQELAAAKEAVQRQKEELKRRLVSKEVQREIVRLLRDDLDQLQVCKGVIRNLARANARGRWLIAATESAMLASTRLAPVSPSLQPILANLEQRITALEKTIEPAQRAVQEQELRSLEDRVWLSSVQADIEAEIKRLKKIAAFEGAIKDTETNLITRKATEISVALVTEALRDAFAQEVVHLKIGDRRLELTQEGSGYGASKYKVSLVRNRGAKVAAILSEGELRCVALAAFLAELSTASHKSGLIFDDPVSSLDHKFRECVASRLILEAASGRQVIVFTHDIPFLMILDHFAREHGHAPQYQCINRAKEQAGICQRGAPHKVRTVPEMAASLKTRWIQTRALYDGGQLDQWAEQAKAMAGILRDGWERAAEAFVAPVVQRYDNRIHPGRLLELSVLTEQDCSDFYKGHQFACGHCHTDSPALNRPAPEPSEFIEEIERLRSWCENIRRRQEQTR